jgi:hypothetical protein
MSASPAQPTRTGQAAAPTAAARPGAAAPPAKVAKSPPIPARSLGGFIWNRGWIGVEDRGFQVKEGSTANGYRAVQTRTGIYRIPDGVQSRLDITGWLRREADAGHISGVYRLDDAPTRRANALTTSSWSVYREAFQTLKGYQAGGLTETDLHIARDRVQAEMQRWASGGLDREREPVRNAVRALWDVQRQLNTAVRAPGSQADRRFESPKPYESTLPFTRFGQPIRQDYLGRSTWGLFLGDSNRPVFSSWGRPVTPADFRDTRGPVQRALTEAGRQRGLAEPGSTRPGWCPAPKNGPLQGPRDRLGQIASLGVPDAIVYTQGALNRAGQRHFALVNLLSGSATHFITHKNDVTRVGNLELKRVEGVQYALGQSTYREDGLGWSQALPSLRPGGKSGATLFLNFRAGDTNLLSDVNGASVNFGLFGPPAELSAVADRLARSSDVRMSAIGRVMSQGLNVATRSGSEIGVAWRGRATLDSRSGELMLNLSGVKIPLCDFARNMATPPGLNRGLAAVARVNNNDAYIAGANPYAFADGTRAPPPPAPGALRNHGDAVSDIAGGIVELARRGPGAPKVRTNAQARATLERSIAAEATLAPAQRQLLDATLRQLHRYAMDFGSPTVRDAAARRAVVGADGELPHDYQFVRDVFEGDFRTPGPSGGNLLMSGVFELAVGVSRKAGVAGAAASMIDAGPIADGTITARRTHADGLRVRLQAWHSGVLPALSIGARDLDPEARDELARRALELLAVSLDADLRQKGMVEPNGEALYAAFQKLSLAERAALGARVRANFDATR